MELNSAWPIITADMNGDALTVATFNRPIRAAWLVDAQGVDGGSGIQTISALAQACCRWWEGRNSILIQVTDKGLPDDAQRILRNHDPDEIIALANVSTKVIEDVGRIVDPLLFSRPLHVRSPISDGDFELHTIASLPSEINLTRRNPSLFSDDPPTLLLFAFSDECPAPIRHFVSLNFGVYPHVVRQQDGKPDFGFADRLWKDLPHRLFVVANIDNFAAALDEIAGDFQRSGLRFVSPMQLAEGRYDRRHRWPADERYHVFLGDSFEDANLFWHQPIVDGTWRLCSRFRFYLPASLALDPKIQLPLQKWLRRSTNAGSSQHKPPIFISRSLEQEEIRRIADHVLTNNQFTIFAGTAEHWDGLHFPAESSDYGRPVLLSELERSEGVEISQVAPRGDTLHVERPGIFTYEERDGRWMSDVFLQTPVQRGLERSGDSLWRLPVARGHDLVSAMFRGAGRVMVNRYPSVAVGGERPQIALQVPRPFDAFSALIRGEHRYFITSDLRYELAQPISAQFGVRVSDKGRSYRGTVELFGTLGGAAHYFESVLWRQLFRDLASEKASTDAALETEIKGVLNKVYEGVEEDRHSDAASRIMGKIRGRSKEVHLTLSEMNEKLTELRDGGRPFPTEQQLGDAILHDDGRCPYTQHTVQSGLTDLMARRVVEAGFEVVCIHCGSVAWLPLGRMAQHGECADCGTRWNAEADTPWRYRLTSLAKRAVQRSGGAMPVLLCIWRLLFESKGSFLWQPNLEIFRPDHEKGEKPWGELDIVCLVDGKFVVGEVKNGIDEFSAHDFDNLRKICEAIRPDVALFVFMEGEFNAQSSFANHLQNLQSQLSPLTRVEWRKVPSAW